VIEDAVYAIGIAHAGLTALIGASPNTRLYPIAEETKHPLPCVVFDKDDPDPVAGIRQDSGWYWTTITFTARAATAREAALVIAQVRLAYQRYFGTIASIDIDDARATGEGMSYYDHELGCYAEEFELRFFHT
jgi:hypothetical protein